MFWFLLVPIVLILLLRIFLLNRKSDSVACLVGKTALVTGGNSGLGYATSVLLASRGCKVIIADRDNAEKSIDEIKRLTGNQEIYYKYLDLSSLKKIRRFAEDISGTEEKIDILVNNAGIGFAPGFTEDGLNTVMQVNYFGAFLLTHLLLDRLRAAVSARIIFLGSVTIYSHNLTLENLNHTKKNGPLDILEVYSNSKLCNVLAAQEFGKKLERYGITAHSVDPAAVKTQIFRQANQHLRSSLFSLVIDHILLPLFGVDPISASQTAFHVATSEQLQQKTGGHYCFLLPWLKPSILRNREFCAAIWKQTEELVKLNPEEKL